MAHCELRVLACSCAAAANTVGFNTMARHETRGWCNKLTIQSHVSAQIFFLFKDPDRRIVTHFPDRDERRWISSHKEYAPPCIYERFVVCFQFSSFFSISYSVIIYSLSLMLFISGIVYPLRCCRLTTTRKLKKRMTCLGRVANEQKEERVIIICNCFLISPTYLLS